MIGLEELRGKLGLGVNDYKLLANFKLRVLELALEQINEHTDIFVKYEQHKKDVALLAFHSSLNKNNSQKLKTD